MAGKLISTKELTGLRVVGSKPSKKDPDATRKIGKVRACVFHPKEKRFVGVIVKRPDAAMMFHRKDLFVAYNGYDMVDGRMVVRNEPEATDAAACRAMGINWDECVLWVDLPVIAQDGADLGRVGDIVFDRHTGAIDYLVVNAGATANALLGVREIPSSMIRGFRQGIGDKLTTYDEEGENAILGAILVDNAAKAIASEGGLAEKAGEATAVVGNKAHQVADDVVKPAAQAAGKAVNKGAYVTGRQISRAKGMFSNFKSEYDKASGKSSTSSGKAGSPYAETAAKLSASAGKAVAKTAAPAVDAIKAAGAKLVEEKTTPVEDCEIDYEVVYVDEDGNEIVYVDEDGNEIIYVDEDGNVVDIDEDDDDFVIVAGRS